MLHRPLPRPEIQSASVGVNHSRPRPVWPGIDYFVPETAKSPFPLKLGLELWVGGHTLPPSVPPRAIQFAWSENGKWQVLQFD